MEFVNKEYFILLTLLIPYIIWYWRNRKHSEPTMRVSTVAAYYKAPKSWRQRIVHAPMVLRCFAFVMIVCVMARPQTRNSWDNKSVEGIDIMLAMDVSTSMLAEDLKPNRLEAAKNVAAEFVAGRPNDNIGLTIFAGESFTQCPMTTDHASLLNLLGSVRTDIAARGIISDGTAIGMGLANAVSRLKESKAKSKVVILLTDGSNNMGDISPMTSAEIAHSLGVRVYTIAVGARQSGTLSRASSRRRSVCEYAGGDRHEDSERDCADNECQLLSCNKQPRAVADIQGHRQAREDKDGR